MTGIVQKLRKLLGKPLPFALPVDAVVNSPTLVLIKTTNQGIIPGKETPDCLTDKKCWAYREDVIDQGLPAAQQNQPACSVSSYQLKNVKGTTFREMAHAALKAAPETPLYQLSSMLLARGLTLTLPAIENLVERQEGGEDVGLCTNGYANFAFVENTDGSVAVLDVSCSDHWWDGSLYSPSNRFGWGVEFRLLLRNSGASTL